MASSNVDILLKVRDEATGKLRSVANEMGGVVATFQRMSIAGGVAGAVLAGLVTAASGATMLAKQYASVAEEVLNLSDASGMSATNVQVFRRYLEQSGGSAEQATKIIGKLNQAIEEQDPILKQIGASNLGTWETLLKLADGFRDTAAGSAKHAAGLKLLGKESEAAIAALSRGSEPLLEFKDRIVQLGVVMSDDTLARFAALDGHLDDMALSMEALKLLLAESVLPALLALFEIIDQIRVRVSLVIPSLIVAADALAILAASTDPRNFQAGNNKIDTLFAKLKDDALALAGAAVKAKNDLDALKQMLAELQKTKSVGLRLGETRKEAKSGGREFGPGNPAGIQEFAQQQMRDAEQAQADFWKSHFLSPMDGGALRKPGGFGMAGAPQKQGDIFRDIVDKWQKAMDDMSSSSERFEGALQAGWNAIGSVTDTVIMGLTSKFQTIGSAWEAVWKTMRDAALKYLAEVVKSELFKLFLKIVGSFVGGGGAAVISGVGGGIPAMGFASGAPAADTLSMMRNAPSSGGSVVNFHVQTLNAKDFYQSIASPSGEMRGANTRLYEVAAAS